MGCKKNMNMKSKKVEEIKTGKERDLYSGISDGQSN